MYIVVVNLESSIAITQNFVSPSNLPGVMFFLKHRADQVSGFKLSSNLPPAVRMTDGTHEYRGEDEDETGGGAAFARFVDALGRDSPTICMEGLKALAKLEMQIAEKDITSKEAAKRKQGSSKSLWNTVTAMDGKEDSDFPARSGFTLGYNLDEADMVEV